MCLRNPRRLHTDETATLSCHAVTSVTRDQAFEDVLRTAEALGAHVEQERTEVAVDNGFIVVTPRADTDVLRAWQRTLAGHSETDTAIMQRGEFASRLTMGIYNGPRSAQRRRAQIAALGVEAQVLPRTRRATGWRAQIEWPNTGVDETASADPALTEFIAKLNASAAPCGRTRAASL